MAGDVAEIIRRQYDETRAEFAKFHAFCDLYCMINHCEFKYRMYDWKDEIDQYCTGKTVSQIRAELEKHIGVPFCEVVKEIEHGKNNH